MKPEEWKWRYLLLFFNCWLSFGCFYNVDILGALQADIQGEQIICTNKTINETCCEECLGVGPFRYNQLFTVFAWTNSLSALPGGVVLDRMGNRAAALVFSAIISIGSLIFTVSTLPNIRRTDVMFPLMFCGRLLLGFGAGTTIVIQQRVVYFWFKDKIAITVGFTFLVLRLATVCNFLITANLQKMMGLTFALWIGVVACIISLISAIGLYLLDYTGTKKLDSEYQTRVKPVPFKISDIRSFPAVYWFLCVTMATLLSSFIPITSNGSKYIQDRYGYSKTTASYFIGAFFDVALVVSPIAGFVSSKVKLNGLCLLMMATLMMPIYPLLSYCPTIHPLIPIICMGCFSTIGVVYGWSSTIRVVPFKSYGLAGGIAGFCEGFLGGMSSLVVGKILGSVEGQDIETRITRDQRMMLLLFSMSVITWILTIIINTIDLKGKREINDRLARNKVDIHEKNETSSYSVNN